MALWDLIPVVGKLLDRVVDKALPDTAEREKAKQAAQLELLKLAQAERAGELDADLKVALAQAEIGKVEAASGDSFTRRARPAVMYVCALSLALAYPVWQLAAIIQAIARGEPIPRTDMGDLMPLLLGMLGLGTMRTVEKVTAMREK